MCVDVINLELKLKDIDYKKQMNRKFSKFRAQILEDCRKQFFSFDDEKKAIFDSDSNAADKLEKELKLKEKFFGNIKFVGELYRRSVLNDNVVNGILQHLIFPEKPQTTDDFIEGAVVFLSKVGYMIDAILAKAPKEKDMQRHADFTKMFGELDRMI